MRGINMHERIHHCHVTCEASVNHFIIVSQMVCLSVHVDF